MLDVVVRYSPIVRSIKKEHLKTKIVLEVGGGGEGIGYYLPDYQIVDCDINFSKTVLPNVKQVKYNGGKLPFPESSYDILVSVDVIEHIPSNIKRRKIINEMLRVARKKVIIAVPVGKNSLEAVKVFRKLYQEKHKGCNHKFAEEHIRYGHPSKKMIIQTIEKSKYKKRIYTENNTNITFWLLFQRIYLKLPWLYLIFKHRRLLYFIL